jgi:hypothetical protein
MTTGVACGSCCTDHQERAIESAEYRDLPRWAQRVIDSVRARALVAQTCGDDVGYRDLPSRYRAMAESLGFEGHIGWAKAMS